MVLKNCTFSCVSAADFSLLTSWAVQMCHTIIPPVVGRQGGAEVSRSLDPVPGKGEGLAVHLSTSLAFTCGHSQYQGVKLTTYSKA